MKTPKLEFITYTPRYTIVKPQDTQEKGILKAARNKTKCCKGMKIILTDNFSTLTIKLRI